MIFGEGDAAFFVEVTEGFFVVFLAATEAEAYLVGRGGVGDGECAAGVVEGAKDGVANGVDAVGGAIEHGKVDFAVGTHLLDAGCDDLLDVEWRVEFAVVDHAPMEVVDDGAEADGGVLDDEGGDFLPGAIVGEYVAKVALDTGGGGDAAGDGVEVDVDEVGAARAHSRFLLGIGYEEVFEKSPVEERACLIDVADLEVGELADCGVGALGGGDGPVVGVFVDEYGDVGTDGHFGCDVAARKKYFGAAVVGEVEPEFDFAGDRESVVFSYLEHC